MMPTATSTTSKKPLTLAITSTIATARNKIAGARCSRCSQIIRELDAIATTSASARPVHVPCLTRAQREQIGYDDTGTDLGQCFYVGCPNRIAPRTANLCHEHHTALYGPSAAPGRTKG